MASNKVLSGALGFALVVVLVVAGVFLLTDSTKDPTLPKPGLIMPSDYQLYFAEGKAEHFLLDVRTIEEFNAGHIAGAVNIPVEVLGRYLNNVPTTLPVIVYCRTGRRSADAVTLLANAGYTQVYDLTGGVVRWQEQGLELE